MENENKKMEENLLVEQMYTTLSEAREEIQRRWNDKDLRKKVEEYLGEVPEVFRNEPRAVIFRFIATPNFETKRFLDLCKIVKMKPVYGEFLIDKFCTRNQDKVHLAKICIQGENASKRKIEKVIEFEKNENKQFKDIETKWGENFIDFHHRMFLSCFNKVDLFDVSLFKKNGESSTDVYIKFLSLFLLNGILFENYVYSKGSYEREFIDRVVFPAFKNVYDKFGIKPLIVPILPLKEELSCEWMCYPENFQI